MHIGRIISDDQNLEVSDYIEIVSVEKYKDDGTLSLIIGKDNVIKIYPNYTLKYLDRNIDEKHSWTFSKFEKRNIYEYDINKFKKELFSKVFEKIGYKALDLVYSKLSVIRKYYNILNNNESKYVFISENAIYVFYEGNIYGISLEEFKYIGITCERLINVFQKGNNILFVFSDKFIKNNDIELKNEPKYIPYLYFLSNS